MTGVALKMSFFPQARAALYAHWKMYVIEAVLLGSAMIAACAFTVLLDYPGSPVAERIASPFARRMLIGIAMGLTNIVLVYSNWGKQSGAHMNPAFTFCFLRLGKMAKWDSVFYMVAQFIGGMLAIAFCQIAAKPLIADPSVNHIVTIPGPYGVLAAWVAEFGISLGLMATILGMNRFPRLIKRTGVFMGGLVALFITIEAPISGMSTNPARTFGSAVVANVFTAIWIYFTAPVAGMLTAVEIYRVVTREPNRLCCKLTHSRKVSGLVQCNCLTNLGTKLNEGGPIHDKPKSIQGAKQC